MASGTPASISTWSSSVLPDISDNLTYLLGQGLLRGPHTGQGETRIAHTSGPPPLDAAAAVFHRTHGQVSPGVIWSVCHLQCIFPEHKLEITDSYLPQLV